MKHTHMPLFLFPTSVAGDSATQSCSTKGSFEARMGPQWGAHKNLQEPTVLAGGPYMGSRFAGTSFISARAGREGHLCGSQDPKRGGFKKAGGRSGRKHLPDPKSPFSKVVKLSCSSHSRCLPLRDLSWYKRRIPVSWTWRLAGKLRRGWTRMWAEAVNSGLVGGFRSAT